MDKVQIEVSNWRELIMLDGMEAFFVFLLYLTILTILLGTASTGLVCGGKKVAHKEWEGIGILLLSIPSFVGVALLFLQAIFGF